MQGAELVYLHKSTEICTIPYSGIEDRAGFLTYHCISITAMTYLQLDLHHIYNNSRSVEDALQQVFDEAMEKRIRKVQIIPGKEDGKLVKKIELFLQQPHIRKHYQRVEKGDKKTGMLTVFFKF